MNRKIVKGVLCMTAVSDKNTSTPPPRLSDLPETISLKSVKFQFFAAGVFFS